MPQSIGKRTRRATAAGPRPRQEVRLTSARIEDIIAQLSAIEAQRGNGKIDIDGVPPLSVTNLAKVYFPTARLTKGDLMRYYTRVAPFLLPLIADRPLVLKRYPDGIGGEAFFQQRAPDRTPSGVRVDNVPADGKFEPRVIAGNLVTLLYGVQLGVITVNPWHSRVGHLPDADYTIIDLDPGPRAPFPKVVQVARWLKEQLDEVGFTAAVKTSGKRGMHIYIPLPPGTTSESARLVAQILARETAERHPKDATTVRAIKGRRQTTVYVDFMQNDLGKSVASVFSVREAEGAPVSTPLDWDALTEDLDPRAFTMESVIGELPARARLWNKAMSVRNRLERLTRAS